MKCWIAAVPLVLACMAAQAATVSPYDHIFVIMEENHEYSQIIGNSNAPNLNSYATTYGLATNYDAVTHPSAPNYVALVGGSFFGIQDDNAWQTHRLKEPDLTSQIDTANLAWKGYFQGMPHPGFKGNCYPSQCYYASKHNGPIYFDAVHNSKAELDKEVPITRLAKDAKHGMPNFAVIVPDQCHDMHGGYGDCANDTDAQLVAAADTYAAGIVSQLTTAKFWSAGNNAIVIVWDEGTSNIGGGGHVAAIVITSTGPRALQDGTAYTHYSLLGTIQDALGLGCLQKTCAAKPMAALFAHP
ncbi:MAG TPA: alkaline phosphatase family protein [Acetobacteraceae bacterium]|nr:alkaline phosphatase family protein [Acetobacteraceae bacterium]